MAVNGGKRYISIKLHWIYTKYLSLISILVKDAVILLVKWWLRITLMLARNRLPHRTLYHFCSADYLGVSSNRSPASGPGGPCAVDLEFVVPPNHRQNYNP